MVKLRKISICELTGNLVEMQWDEGTWFHLHKDTIAEDVANAEARLAQGAKIDEPYEI